MPLCSFVLMAGTTMFPHLSPIYQRLHHTLDPLQPSLVRHF